MVSPRLWGPTMWDVLLSCAWNGEKNVDALREMLLVQLPLLLPCQDCRQHFAKNVAVVHRLAGGEPRTTDAAFHWLYLLKDAVTLHRHPRTLLPRAKQRDGARSSLTLPFDDLLERYQFHGGAIDEVKLCDMLVLVALDAHERGFDDAFLQFWRLLLSLLPLPPDSQVLQIRVSKPVISLALSASKSARVERGLPWLRRSHYDQFISS